MQITTLVSPNHNCVIAEGKKSKIQTSSRLYNAKDKATLQNTSVQAFSMADEETWQCEFQGAKSYGAYGLRDVLILANSQAQLVQPTAVARERGELTASDRDRLGSQGFPGQSWETEEELVEARYVKDSTRYHNVLVMQCSGLAREDILRSIRNVLSGTSKPGGMCVHTYVCMYAPTYDTNLADLDDVACYWLCIIVPLLIPCTSLCIQIACRNVKHAPHVHTRPALSIGCIDTHSR